MEVVGKTLGFSLKSNHVLCYVHGVPSTKDFHFDPIFGTVVVGS